MGEASSKSPPENLITINYPSDIFIKKKETMIVKILLTSLSGVSVLNKDKATPVNAIAPTAPTRPIPLHTSHPFCKLKGCFKSEYQNKNKKKNQRPNKK